MHCQIIFANYRIKNFRGSCQKQHFSFGQSDQEGGGVYPFDQADRIEDVVSDDFPYQVEIMLVD